MTTKDKDLRVTIRLIPEKAQVYDDFKDVVTNRLHSDICYVTTMLMESFVSAVNETSNPDDPLTMHFVKQNVQVNMGCNFNYYTKKARRNAPDRAEDVITDTHNLLPNVVDDFQNISEKARKFWFEEFQAQGIIPKNKVDPSVSTGKQPMKKFSFFGKVWSYCKTIVTKKRNKIK
jgi:hypothetical protein